MLLAIVQALDLPTLVGLAVVLACSLYWCFCQFVVKALVVRRLRKELGTDVRIKELVVRPLAGVFELRGLAIQGDATPSGTVFATVERVRCTTTGPLGTLSLAGPQALPLGMHVPWVVGFRGKMIEGVSIEGATIVVEEHDGVSNGAFLRRRAVRIKAKSAAKKRRVLETELRWRLLHVDDKEAVRSELDILKSLDGDSDSDDEHEAYMESAHAEWDADDAQAAPKQSYAERLQAARERVARRVAARQKARADDHARQDLQEDLKQTYATIRPAFNDSLIHIGSLSVERCAVTLRGRKVRLDHPVRIAAYCGTMRAFQKLVVKRVMTQALADSVQHKRAKTRERIKERAEEARASLKVTKAAVREKLFGPSEARLDSWAVPDKTSLIIFTQFAAV